MDYKDGLLPIIEYHKDLLIKNGWFEAFASFVTTKEFNELNEKLITDRLNNIEIYPLPTDIFNALLLTDIKDVTVVIIGQDPYHTKGVANGLAFSTNAKPQPSLKNIFKEVKDCGYKVNETGDLSKWAAQGVLLINTALTVQQHKAGSHLKYWEPLIINIFRLLIKYKDYLVILMWGKQAQRYDYLLQNYNLLTCPHPSPFSADSGFFGCRHFNKCNQILSGFNLKNIDWNLY